MSSAFSSWVPCDMLMRTPSTPAANSASITLESREAGPMVASIFARLKMDLSKEKRHYGRNFAGIGFELLAESFAQKLFFAAHAHYRADGEYYDRYEQPDPETDCQAGRQQH